MDDATFFAGLVPELAKLAKAHREGCAALHLPTIFSAGRRTWAEQLVEYEKGRARSSQGWIVVDEREVVTHALPPEAPHVRGGAYDLWLLFGRKGEGHLRRATMDPRDSWTPQEIEQQTILWGAVVRVGTELGLEAGAGWSKIKDFPHFELKFWRELPMPVAP